MNDEFHGLPPRDAEAEGTSATTLAMIGGLVAGALAFLLVGLGLAFGWFGPLAEDESEASGDTVEEPDTTETGEDEPARLAKAELMPTVESAPRPTPTEDTELANTEPVPEILPAGQRRASGEPAEGGGGGGGSGGGGARKYAGPRVSVAFNLGHYEHVELEIGGKVFKLDNNRTLKLRPGGYQIQLRKGPEHSWTSAGLVEVEAGSRYRVTLFDPPLAKLEVLE